MLPDWFDLDALRLTIAGAVVLIAVVALATLVFVRSVTRKVVVLLVLGGLAGASLWYRSTLDECEQTCSCKVVFTRIPIDGCVQAEDS